MWAPPRARATAFTYQFQLRDDAAVCLHVGRLRPKRHAVAVTCLVGRLMPQRQEDYRAYLPGGFGQKGKVLLCAYLSGGFGQKCRMLTSRFCKLPLRCSGRRGPFAFGWSTNAPQSAAMGWHHHKPRRHWAGHLRLAMLLLVLDRPVHRAHTRTALCPKRDKLAK